MTCRGTGAPGDSSYDASITVQRVGTSHQDPLTPPSLRASATTAVPAINSQGSNANKPNSQQAHRRQAALHHLAARSRSRSASSSRAVSRQPSETALEQHHQRQQTLLDETLSQDAAAARLAEDYLAAVHSAASVHSAAAASSASSWPQQSDMPQWMHQQQQQQQQGTAQGDQQHLEWEGMLRRGVELAHGPSTDQFLQVVDLFPQPGLGQVTTCCSLLGKALATAFQSIHIT